MRFSNKSDAETVIQSVRDGARSLPEMIAERWQEDVKRSFDESYRLMSSEGKPALFFMKAGAVGLGSIMIADGIHHMVAGADEEVDDLFIHAKTGSNYVRIFTGITELGFGAMLAYLGAVKGPLKATGVY